MTASKPESLPRSDGSGVPYDGTPYEEFKSWSAWHKKAAVCRELASERPDKVTERTLLRWQKRAQKLWAELSQLREQIEERCPHSLEHLVCKSECCGVNVGR